MRFQTENLIQAQLIRLFFMQELLTELFFVRSIRQSRLQYLRLKRLLTPYMQRTYHLLKQYARRKWILWEPHLNKLFQLSVAISTATSTLRLTIEIMPVILSVLTVLSALPLFGVVLPSILFQPRLMFPIMLLISGYVGYRKYNEQVLRAQLDRQIEVNQKNIQTLKKEITSLKLTIQKSPLLFYSTRQGRRERHLLQQQAISNQQSKMQMPRLRYAR